MIGRIRKGVSLFLAMLMLMATIAVPVAVAETNTGTNTETTVGTECNTCGAQITEDNCGCSGGCGNSNITVVQLNGAEANKAIADALKNDDVKELHSKLIQMGYTPMRNEAEVYAYSGSIDSNDVEAVLIPFDTHSVENASILWISTNDNIIVRAIINGDATLSSEPMNILVADDKYKEIANNLTSFGYKINTEAATVFIEPSMIANIMIPIDGKADAILGVVDLNTGEVISVQNGFWDCVTDCVCDADPFNCIVVLSACTGACGSCIAVPNPWTCIPCYGCMFGYGYCIGACL